MWSETKRNVLKMLKWYTVLFVMASIELDVGKFQMKIMGGA